MTLFDKSIVSFISNALASHYSGSPQPSLCIADITSFQATPIQAALVQKIAQHSNKSQTTSDRSANLIMIAHQLHPFFHSPQFSNQFTPICPSSITNQHGFRSTQLFTLESLKSALLSAIQSIQPSPSSFKPTILLIDSLDHIFDQFSPIQIPSIVQTLSQLPTVSGIIVKVPADTFSLTESTFHPIDQFDAITANFTTLFQTLPPPSSDPQAILACHVVHRHSSGKITNESVSLRIDQNSGKLISINPTSAQSSNSTGNQAGDLPEGLKDLPFNLALTQHQIQQRSHVELPYAHQGASSMAQTPGTGFKVGLLSSTPVSKNNLNFDEVVDDDEDDEL